jgi:hypothetical protein
VDSLRYLLLSPVVIDPWRCQLVDTFGTREKNAPVEMLTLACRSTPFQHEPVTRTGLVDGHGQANLRQRRQTQTPGH